jgi:hypothetical protein
MIIDLMEQRKVLDKTATERSSELSSGVGQVVLLSAAVKLRAEQKALQEILERANKQRS